MNLNVGDKVELLKTMLGNDSGTVGIVFYKYDGGGVQIIFPNGQYDGFSKNEQYNYLEFIEHVYKYENYLFENVVQVSIDFEKGYWRFDKP